MNGWITPVLQRRDGRAYVISPVELADREVIRVDAHACGNRPESGPGDVLCGLVRNHGGPCWLCSVELVKFAGPFAVVVPDES